MKKKTVKKKLMLAMDFKIDARDPGIIHAHTALSGYYNSYTWVLIVDFIVLKKIFINLIKSIAVLILCVPKV